MKNTFLFKIPNSSNDRSFIILLIIIFLITTNLNIVNANDIKINNKKCQNIDINDLIFNIKIKSLMRLGSYPSLSIYAIENNEVIWSEFYGYSDIYNKIKPDKNTVYIIGSISKTFTAVAIMQLYEQGYLNLDDDINQYLPFSLRNPNFPDTPITFRMLLSHRSSIYDYHLYSKQGKIELAYCFPMIDNLCEIFDEFLTPEGHWYHPECWLNSSPGETTVYSSFGIMVLSYLVEKLSGQSIEEYCKLNIFEPMNMNNSFFHPCINNTRNIATPYIRLFRVYIPLPQYDPKCLCSIGGLHTSIEDLSHYLIALMNDGIYKGKSLLNKSSLNEMFKTIYPEEVFSKYFPHTYGLVFWETKKFGEKLIGHGGGAPGYLCDMYMNLSTRRGFIMFSNHCNPGSPAYNLAYLRLYPKIHIIRTTIGKIIMDRINDQECDVYV